VYDNHALHLSPTIVRWVLGCAAASLWALYLHEILFRSGKVQTHWIKRRLRDLLVMLAISLATLLFAMLVGAISFHHGR
jgi:branched-subunit amino acid transport protein